MKKRLFKLSATILMSLAIGACTSTPTKTDNATTNTVRQQLELEGIPFSADALAHFAKEGNIGKVQQLLDSGVDVNATEGQATALMVASACKKTDMVKYLIERGADINITTYHGTALSIASLLCEKVDIPKILLQHGANPNVIVLDGYTPLMLAALGNKAENIKALIDCGANIEYRHPVTSHTALTTAAYYGKTDAVLALIKCGANLNYVEGNSWCEKSGFSALDWSQIGSHDDITKTLLEHGAKISLQSNKAPLVMLAALAHEDLPLIDLLVSKGVSVNTVYEKMPILVWCARCNIPNSAMELIKLGADISAKDSEGRTALDWAILNGQKKLVQYINPKIDVSKINIPEDPNTLNQATLVGELINDQYYQGTVTSVQGLEGFLNESLTSDTSLMKDLRADVMFKNPALKTDTAVVHPEWENVNEFEHFDKQIKEDIQSIDKYLNTQSDTAIPNGANDKGIVQPIPSGSSTNSTTLLPEKK